jgi:hypothetical protein
LAGKNTFRSKTFASKTFASGTYNGLGVTPAPPPVIVPAAIVAPVVVVSPLDTVDVDHDTMSAVRLLWQTDAAALPLIVDRPIQSGRLKSGQASTYAVVTSEIDHRDSAGTGGAWHDYRKVTIKVYGVKADVVKAVSAVQKLFNLRTVLTYPSGASFRRWWPQGTRLAEDPATRAGQDVWTCTIEALAWSMRILSVGAKAPATPAAVVPPAGSGGGYDTGG